MICTQAPIVIAFDTHNSALQSDYNNWASRMLLLTVECSFSKSKNFFHGISGFCKIIHTIITYVSIFFIPSLFLTVKNAISFRKLLQVIGKPFHIVFWKLILYLCLKGYKFWSLHRNINIGIFNLSKQPSPFGNFGNSLIWKTLKITRK